MSIIYDALQKTQRNREYFRVQNGLTQIKPHRRNIKWMVLGSLVLALGAGVGGVFSFFALSRQPASNYHAAVKPAPAPAPAKSEIITQGAHLWVTDSRKTTETEPAAPVTTSLPVPVVAQAAPSPSLPQSAPTPDDDPLLLSTPPAQPQAAAPSPTSQPVVSGTLIASNLTLNGVLISGADKVALINNQAFHLGDVVDGMKIVGIDSTSVKLQRGNQVVELRVSV